MQVHAEDISTILAIPSQGEEYLKVGKLIEDNMTTPREYFGLVAR